nr:hypothetical protein Iba_chr11cCG11250 [Ipomoea batatas]
MESSKTRQSTLHPTPDSSVEARALTAASTPQAFVSTYMNRLEDPFETKIEESRHQPDTKNKSSLNLVSGGGVKIAADVGGGKIFVRRCRIERSALVFRPCSNSQSSSFAICSAVVQHPTCFCPGSAFVYFSP